MREIKFRAWCKHTVDKRWNWAYRMADERVTACEKNQPGESFSEQEDEWRREYEEQWNKDHPGELPIDENNVMVYGEEVSVNLNGKIGTRYGYALIELMQSTGLKDRNGKDIYEGDVIRITNAVEMDEPVDSKAVVRFRDGAFVTDYHDCLIRIALPGNWTVEVIGNIFETPDLLK